MKPFIHVVAGLIRDEDKVFIAQRLPNDSSPGKWEFPGGKVEEGEDPHTALHRELHEELEIKVKIKGLFGVNQFENERAVFRLELYECEVISGEFAMHEHSDHKWVYPADLKLYDLLSGDLPFVEKLLKP